MYYKLSPCTFSCYFSGTHTCPRATILEPTTGWLDFILSTTSCNHRDVLFFRLQTVCTQKKWNHARTFGLESGILVRIKQALEAPNMQAMLCNPVWWRFWNFFSFSMFGTCQSRASLPALRWRCQKPRSRPIWRFNKWNLFVGCFSITDGRYASEPNLLPHHQQRHASCATTHTKHTQTHRHRHTLRTHTDLESISRCLKSISPTLYI